MSIGEQIVTAGVAADVISHIGEGFIAVDPRELNKDDEIRAVLPDDPTNTVIQGRVQNEPAQELLGDRGQEIGRILVNTGLIEKFRYPESHPMAKQEDERIAPTVVLPMGVFNDINHRASDVQYGQSHKLRRYSFFVRTS